VQGPSVVLLPSGSARWDALAGGWLCRYKASTQRTYAVHLPRWAEWVASDDVNGDALERHASHQIAGFLAGWAG
jgi:integrase/recombinase XerC/integrase/recombinase XerD